MVDDEISVVAARCLEDVTHAREVLAGRDYPHVRAALVADLDAALEDAREKMLNPQPLPPEPPPDTIWVMTERIWLQWPSIERPRLRRLAKRDFDES